VAANIATADREAVVARPEVDTHIFVDGSVGEIERDNVVGTSQRDLNSSSDGIDVGHQHSALLYFEAVGIERDDFDRPGTVSRNLQVAIAGHGCGYRHAQPLFTLLELKMPKRGARGHELPPIKSVVAARQAADRGQRRPDAMGGISAG
jgi:hypothetical protein